MAARPAAMPSVRIRVMVMVTSLVGWDASTVGRPRSTFLDLRQGFLDLLVMRSRLTESVEAEDKVSQTIVRDQDFNPMPEPGAGGIANRLNWLRAGVMGANDGIVSTAAKIGRASCRERVCKYV